MSTSERLRERGQYVCPCEYTLHRTANAIKNIERYSPGIELSIRGDNPPAAVLARRAPKHIVVPTDLDDHFIPDAEPEGIVPRPGRGSRE